MPINPSLVPLSNSTGLLPGDVRFQQTTANAIREIGAAGTPIYAGQFDEESVAALSTAKKRYSVYREMRADPQVSALLSVIMLPIQSSAWQVVAKEEDGQLGEEIAEFIGDNLFSMPDCLWDDFLRQALLMIAYGFSIFEIVYEKDAETRKLRWKKFAPRHWNTIEDWNVDSNGNLVSVTQQISYLPKKNNVVIPEEKLLRFTYRQEAGDFSGRPILRDAYKAWWYKDLMYRIQGIGAERMGIGFPLAKLPRDQFIDEMPTMRDFLRAVRVNEEGGLAIPDDYSFEFLPAQPFAYEEAINHHNRMIALTGLAQFLNLGADRVGSYALSKTHGQFFLLALKATARYITDVMESVAFRKLVDLNWGPDAPVPDLEFQMVQLDATEIATALANLVNGQLLLPTKDIRQTIREWMNLPLEDEDVEPEAEPPEDVEESEHFHAAMHDPRLIPKGQAGPYWRPFTAKETKSEIEVLDRRWQRFDRDLLRQSEAILDKQVELFFQRLQPLLQQGSITEISQLAIGGNLDLMRVFNETAVEAADWARAQAVKNLGIADPGANVRARRLLGVELQMVIPRLQQTLASTLTRRILTNTALQSEIAEGAVSRETAASVVRDSHRLYNDFAEKTLPNFTEPQVGRAVREGREEVLQSPRVVKAERTEILDSNTCWNCQDLDGQVSTVFDPDFSTVKPPSQCLGGGRCRGTLLFYLDDEGDVPEDTAVPKGLKPPSI